jgi:hypothetical protein
MPAVLKLIVFLLVARLSISAGPQFRQAPVLSADRRIEVRLEQALNSKTSRTGDPVSAIVDEAILSASSVILPKGTKLEGRVESVRPGDIQDHGWMRLLFHEIVLPDGRRLSAQFSNLFTVSDRHAVVRYVLPLAIGTGLGWMLGGSKARTSAALGGLLGGSVIAFGGYRSVKDVKLGKGRRIPLRLGQDLHIPALD